MTKKKVSKKAQTPALNKGVVTRSFYLTKEKNQRYINWKASLPQKYFGAIGGSYSFIFTPTSLGDIVKVKRCDGYEIDLTDYDSF